MQPFLNNWGHLLTKLTVRLPKSLHRRRAPEAHLEGVSLRTVAEQLARKQAELMKQVESLTLAIASLERAISKSRCNRDSKQGEDHPGLRLDRAGNLVPKKPPRADKTVACQDCGSEFVFPVVEQLLALYIEDRTRCPSCRPKGEEG